MKSLDVAVAIIFGIMFAVCASTVLFAEQIQHHGILVESEGTARDCVSCHDPSLAGDPRYCTTKCGIITSHSIDRDYPPVENRELYASLEEVTARGVKLINGKVSCVSCHNLNNPGRFHLVADSRELCIICHVRYYR
jgi:hypothetical protein